MNLYGASGHAKVILSILKAQGSPVEAIIDDNKAVTELLGYQVSHQWQGQGPIIVSIGANAVRKKVVKRLGNVQFGIAIHPLALVDVTARVGCGTVVMQGAIIQADAQIGKHCIVNTGAAVDHECVIGDYAHVSPHATICGNVQVGEGAWIGAGAVLIPGVKVGPWPIIGAGAVVVHDIPGHVVAFGNPCRVCRRLPNMD